MDDERYSVGSRMVRPSAEYLAHSQCAAGFLISARLSKTDSVGLSDEPDYRSTLRIALSRIRGKKLGHRRRQNCIGQASSCSFPFEEAISSLFPSPLRHQRLGALDPALRTSAEL